MYGHRPGHPPAEIRHCRVPVSIRPGSPALARRWCWVRWRACYFLQLPYLMAERRLDIEHSLRSVRERPRIGGRPCFASVAAMSRDLPELRASHEDRDRVVDTLRTAAGDGRLTAEELDARVERALSARTQGELAALVADLSAATATKDVLVVKQTGGKWTRAGRWTVPNRIEVRTKLCRVTFDFTDGVITSRTVRIDTDMQNGKVVIVGAPGIVIGADGLNLVFSKTKLRSDSAAADPRLRIELVGTLKHAKVIERRP